MVGLLTASSGLVMASASTASATSGNNGTVKIDGDDLRDGSEEDGSDNEPFVGCAFRVQWTGYALPANTQDDDVDYSVTFELKSPTDGANGNAFASDSNDIGSFVPTPAEGDLDFEKEYSLDISGPPHLVDGKHGYHVKVTVTTEYSRGNDIKHKVFWTGPCQDDPSGEQICPQGTTAAVRDQVAGCSTPQSDRRVDCTFGHQNRSWTEFRPWVWNEQTEAWSLGALAVVDDSGWVSTGQPLTQQEYAQAECPGTTSRDVTEERKTCPDGVQVRSSTITTSWVWDSVQKRYVSSSSGGGWSAWTTIRALNNAEFVQLGCRGDQPEPDVVTLSDERTRCVGVQQRSGSRTTSYIWDETARAYAAVVGEEVWGPWKTVRPLSTEELLAEGCVLGEETTVPKPKPKPEPEQKPTVKGVERVAPPAAVPTAVAAGVGGGEASSSMTQLMSQMLLGGGLLLLLAGGWVGLGRREAGAHEA